MLQSLVDAYLSGLAEFWSAAVRIHLPNFLLLLLLWWWLCGKRRRRGWGWGRCCGHRCRCTCGGCCCHRHGGHHADHDDDAEDPDAD